MDRLLDRLRESYLTGHAQNVSPAIYENLQAIWPYFEENYAFILRLPRDASILEIGSGSGAFLAWLKQHGFTNLCGLDISPEEVERATQRGIPLICTDANEYLEQIPAHSVDVIVAKALFEHMQKQEGADMVERTTRALKSETGILILDVPNMDWIASNHERYMDLTHHVGYTRESMSQMLLLYFLSVRVEGSREPVTSRGSSLRVKILKPLLVRIIRFFLRILGEGAANVIFESRGIIAVARQPR